jgi:hypothetical protein
MGKTVLVGMDVEKGSKIVQILDDAGLHVKVALWAFLSDYEDWRFVLSSVKFDAEPRRGYGLYHRALEAAGMTLEETPVIVILNSKDRFIRETNYYLFSSLFFGMSTLTLRAVNVRSTSSLASTVTGVSMSISDGLID